MPYRTLQTKHGGEVDARLSPEGRQEIPLVTLDVVLQE
jgi:hypothetical protein